MHQLTLVETAPAEIFGVRELRQDAVQVSARMTAAGFLTGPDGRVALGALGVLVDEVLGYALMGSLPPGSWSISTEIWVDLVGPRPGRGDELVAVARPRQAGSFSVGEVRQASGRLVAECRQRGRFVPLPAELDGARPDEAGSSAPLDAEDLVTMLDLRADGQDEVMRVRVGLSNPRGMLHGGVSLAASEVVAVRSRLASGCSLPTSSLHIVHSRAVPAGASVVFHAETRHAGRTLWVTDVVGSVEGRTCTVMTVTAQE